MTCTVRPLGPRDANSWRLLWTAYLAFYNTTVPEEVYSTTWKRLLGDDYYDPRGMIAEIAGQPVGLVQYLFHRHGWRVENVTYLQDLYTAPEARGQGIGRALIEAVYQVADDAECPAVYWLTEQDNDVARSLYDRIGNATKFMKYQR